MLKKSVWKKYAGDAVSVHQEQALSTTILLLKTYGPTGFLLREEGQDSDCKVFLGQPHSCTCPVFLREGEPCKHICWILLKKFQLPKEHEYSFQCGLSERQISEVLQGSHQTPQPSPPGASPPAAAAAAAAGWVLRRDIQPQDVCPICQEELLERRQPVAYCRFSCGNNVHISCMKVWADHRQHSASDSGMVKCPLCREDFCSVQSLWEQVKNAAQLHTAAERESPNKHLGVSCTHCRVTPISGKCFRCTVCTHVYFCESCSEKDCHLQHQLAVRSTRKEEWCLMSKHSREASSVNDHVLDGPLSLAPLRDSVLAQVAMVQVRVGSPLLQDGVQCRMCLQTFTLGETLRVLPCRHKFHAGCVDGILQTTHACPLDGFVIYNPETRRGSGKKSNSKLASPNTRPHASQTAGTNLKDLFVPGVALQEKKHQTEVPTNSSTVNATTSQKCMKKITSPPVLCVSVGDKPQPSLYVGALNPKPQSGVSVCRRARIQPKIRSTVDKEAPSQLTMTGVLLTPQSPK
ncbi:E3 ubiquitin-protein ligase ZSWIM2 [Boleophthalmus pectinirostris]|uniref:E3 ubiquitin-protein ligase ZSWIM2 n=1 Tax=Boleophthalmus pectinirostris TaxID=150288 RepID=UPI00242E05A6|nr:E3 ubiquitin-protein ligase ZSWIM2 [Boleophthalmus pectinirostris]